MLPTITALEFMLLLASFIVAATKTLRSPPDSKSICSDRCDRLLRRSLDRVDQSLSVEEVLYRIGTFRKAQLLSGGPADSSSEEITLPAEQFKDICWKFFDFEDCHKQCQKMFSRGRGRRKRRRSAAGGKHRVHTKALAVVQPEHRLVLHFCRRANLGISLEQFACVHKYHSFLEVHCSSYQQRAVQLRLIGLQLEQPDIDGGSDNKFGSQQELDQLRKAVDQELCLLLHQQSACLVNAGMRFCPSAKSSTSGLTAAANTSTPASAPILSRHSLREHHLSLLLPFGRAVDQRAAAQLGQQPPTESPVELDQLFSDVLLDHCQLFDFHRMAQEWMARLAEEGEEGNGGKVANNNEEEDAVQRQREFELMRQAAEAAEEADEQQRSTTKRAVFPKISTEQGVEVTVAPSNRRVFSSEEDLMDTPPNFFYSTARLPKDFYTRYAVWWGSRGWKSGERRASQETSEELTAVELLPTTSSSSSPRAHSQVLLSTRPMPQTVPIVQKEQQTTESTRRTSSVGSAYVSALIYDEEVPAITETWPDTSLSTPSTPTGSGPEEEEKMVEPSGSGRWTVTLPYKVNGHVTRPVPRWPGELGRTEIQLMDGTTRRLWTTEEGEREWKRREQKEGGRGKAEAGLEEMEGREDDDLNVEEERENEERNEGEEKASPIEEYEEEWAYEDEFGSSEFEDEEQGPSRRRNKGRKKGVSRLPSSTDSSAEDGSPSILRPVISSSVEELIEEIGSDNNDPPKGQAKVWPSTPKSTFDQTSPRAWDANVLLLPAPTTEEPMFRETNIYFAKILEFGQEPEDAEWLHSNRAAETTSPKTVAHMVHFPAGDQLPAVRRVENQESAELDEDHQQHQQQRNGVWPAAGQRHREEQQHPHQQHHQSPYEILPADPDEFMMTTPDHGVKWRSGGPSDDASSRSRRPNERPKILVSAEPVPAKKSETLLVLLGVYLTFFALAAFFLFCLVLACLERNRRQQSRRRSGAKQSNGGSAILYMDPKKGTLKHVV